MLEDVVDPHHHRTPPVFWYSSSTGKRAKVPTSSNRREHLWFGKFPGAFSLYPASPL